MSGPTFRDLDMSTVFMQYGRTMLAVQMFEIALIQLYLVKTASHSQKPKTPQRLAALLTKRMRRFQNTIERGTSGRVMRELTRVLDDPELIDRLEVLVHERNSLAHHYLWRRLSRDDRTRMFLPGTRQELERLSERFAAAEIDVNHRSMHELRQLASQLDFRVPDADGPMDAWVRRVMLGDPPGSGDREPGST